MLLKRHKNAPEFMHILCDIIRTSPRSQLNYGLWLDQVQQLLQNKPEFITFCRPHLQAEGMLIVELPLRISRTGRIIYLHSLTPSIPAKLPQAGKGSKHSRNASFKHFVEHPGYLFIKDKIPCPFLISKILSLCLFKIRRSLPGIVMIRKILG